MLTLQLLLDTGLNTSWFSRQHPDQFLLTQMQDEILVVLESSATLIFDLRRSQSKFAIGVSFATFFRAVTGRSATGSVLVLFQELASRLSEFATTAQSSSWIDVLDDLHKNVHRVKDSTLGRKLISVLNHVVAHTFYHKMGLEVDSGLFHKIEKGYIRPNLWNVGSFVDALVGLLLFLAKAGRQALLTGSSEPFYVDSTTISDWLMLASRLRKDSEFLSNPQAIGLDTPMYLADIESAIATGNSLRKSFGESQKTIINSAILELEMILKRHTSSLSAASFRFCPYGVFLFGDSGVGKSFLAKGLFNHYCSVRNIPKEKAILYPRGPDDPFYSQFKSSMPGIIFDDVAKHKSAKVMGIDLSLSDIISVCNNIPMLTNQAELSDKGKVPLLCEWMGVTSNIEQLAVHDYYTNSYAVLRRMPYRIEPIVKPEFRKQGSTCLDPSKVPVGEQYPDCWTFIACKVIKDDNGLTGRYEPRENGRRFACYADLLAWLTLEYSSHIENQMKLIKAVAQMGPEELCHCLLPASICACEGDGAYIGMDAIRVPELQIQNQHGGLDQQLGELFAQKRLVQAHGKNLVGLEKLFNTRWLSDEFSEYLDMVVNQTGVCEINDLYASYLRAYCDFIALPLAEQSRSLMRREVSANQASYLTFVPEVGTRRSFVRDHLKDVLASLQPLIEPLQWNEAQMAALEVYLYEEVPKHIAAGWSDSSIYQGALDYVDHHEVAYRDRAPSVLTAEPIVGYKERICRWLGYQYFSRPWLFRTTNFLADTRLGRWMLGRSVWVQTQALHAAADAYNVLLSGDHPLVKLLIAACAMATIWTLAKAVFGRYAPEPQVSIHTIGRKPIVRKGEKKNVWVKTESSITSLDFHPRRPNNRTQLDALVGRNVFFTTFRAPGIATGKTACLIADNNTIVMNAHCVFVPMKLTIHMGNGGSGVQPTLEIDIEEGMVRIEADRDLAVIKTKALPATFKDIKRCFAMRSFNGVGPGTYHIVRQDTAADIPVFGIEREHVTIPLSPRIEFASVALIGKPDELTQYGDCGCPLIMETARGPIIAGIHFALNQRQRVTFATPVYYEDLDFSPGPVIQTSEVEPAYAIAQSYEMGMESDDDWSDSESESDNDEDGPITLPLSDSDKLYTRFHEEGTIITMGQLQSFRPRFKASGKKSLIGEAVLKHPLATEMGITDRLHRPVMSGWEPQQNILKEYLHPTHSMRETVIIACSRSFSRHIRRHLTPEDREDIHPVTLDVAVNGYPGVPNVDAQKFGTAAGHGLPGPKKAYVEYDGPLEEWPRCRKYNRVIRRGISKILRKARKGIRSHPIFTAHLKDEMVSLRKVLAKKTRGFYMCPVEYLTAMRMYTMGITRVMVRRRSVFRIAVGLNAHSEEWNALFLESAQIPGDNWLAGDFVGFDKILSILIQNCAADVFLDIARQGGFSQEDLLVLETLMADTITPTVDFFGELITLLGGEVSGHQLTTFFNCVCNVLLHQYAFVILGLEQGLVLEEFVDSFWDLVFICVLGDDIIAKVHPDITWYNHTAVQRVFASIGIEYTMADKTSVSRPYIPYTEVTFLKRTFREHPDLPGMMVAPLDRDSIYKMLLYTVPSRTETEEVQLAQACAAALSEAFYHGPEFYKRVEQLIGDCSLDPELVERQRQAPLPSYAACFARFCAASPSFQASAGTPGDFSEVPQTKDSYCQPEDIVVQAGWSVDPWGSTTMGRSPEEAIQSGIRLSPKPRHKPARNEKRAQDENIFLSKAQCRHPNTTAEEYEQMALSSVATAISNHNNKRRRRVKSMRWKGVVPQSAMGPDTAGSVNSTQELYTFQAEPIHDKMDLSGRSNIIATDQTLTSSLASYMSRPELVSTITWQESDGVGLKSSINIWQLAMTTSKREKLSGFGLFRANLKLKFVINGSPFYYGALGAMYTPLSGHRTDTVGGSTSQILCLASQKPHVWLNVQNTSTAEMKIPFLFPYPHMNTNQLSNFGTLGKIDYYVYRTLQSANGVTGSAVDVQIYAWFEDVELTGPTNQPVAQSSIEYTNDHQISGPASAVASVAGALSTVPVLGPYAMATAEAATMVSTVANALGYTNVPNVSDIQPVKQKPFSLSSGDISEPMDKLSLTAKQEVKLEKVDYGAAPEDELFITRFCGRESYLATSSWDTTQTSGTILFTSGVTPMLTVRTSSGVAMVPMAYAATAFQYWRGSVKFTFKAIRSKYHRGRVQISWDRSSNNLNTGALLGNPNTLSVVLDLDEGDEVSMVVPFQQQSLFLPVSGPYTENGAITGSDSWSTSTAPSSLTGVGWNGVLNMRVLTRLTAPEATSDIAFLVFVSAGEDFELAGPASHRFISTTSCVTLSNLTTTVAQSDIQYNENAPDTTQELGDTRPEVYYDTFGESFPSLRALLHRSTKAITWLDNPATSPSNPGVSITRIPLKHMPPIAGLWNNAWYTTVTPVNRINLAPWHPLPWFTYCFAGYSGSVNVSANAINTNATQTGYVDHFTLSRATTDVSSSSERQPSSVSVNLAGGASQAISVSLITTNREPGSAGMALTNNRTNAGLSANLPFYSPGAFYVADPFKTYNNTDTLSGTDLDWWRIEVMEPVVASQPTLSAVDIYYASGPDFNVHFFVNCPMTYSATYTL